MQLLPCLNFGIRDPQYWVNLERLTSLPFSPGDATSFIRAKSLNKMRIKYRKHTRKGGIFVWAFLTQLPLLSTTHRIIEGKKHQKFPSLNQHLNIE